MATSLEYLADDLLWCLTMRETSDVYETIVISATVQPGGN